MNIFVVVVVDVIVVEENEWKMLSENVFRLFGYYEYELNTTEDFLCQLNGLPHAFNSMSFPISTKECTVFDK